MHRLRNKLNHLLSDYRHAQLAVEEEETALKDAKTDLLSITEALDLVQEAAESIQNQVHHQLASVVTESLKEVFDDPYEFMIHFEKKRNKTEARLIFKRGDLKLDDPTNEAGVGQVDIASLALRIACLLLMRPKRRLLIVMDEALKNINGADNRKRAAFLLTTLADRLGFQIIQATGNDWLTVGGIIDLNGDLS